MITRPDERLLSCKELAWHLNRHVNYVYQMRRAGFEMVAHRTTLQEALNWLRANPDWQHRLPPRPQKKGRTLPACQHPRGPSRRPQL
jgi:hypothetical protein